MLLQTIWPCQCNQEYMLNFTSIDLPEDQEIILMINQTNSINISLVLNSDCENASIDESGRLRWMITDDSYLVVLVSTIDKVSSINNSIY